MPELGQVMLLGLSLKKEPVTSQGMKTTHQTWSTDPKMQDSSSNGDTQITVSTHFSLRIAEVLALLLQAQLTALTYFLPLPQSLTPKPFSSSWMNKTQVQPRGEAFVLVSHRPPPSTDNMFVSLFSLRIALVNWNLLVGILITFPWDYNRTSNKVQKGLLQRPVPAPARGR